MPTFDINLEEPAWPELGDRPQSEILFLPDTKWFLGALQAGMETGAPSLALRFDWDRGAADGTTSVIAQTSLRAWIAATGALRGRFPESFAGTPLAAPRRNGR